MGYLCSLNTAGALGPVMSIVLLSLEGVRLYVLLMTARALVPMLVYIGRPLCTMRVCRLVHFVAAGTLGPVVSIVILCLEGVSDFFCLRATGALGPVVCLILICYEGMSLHILLFTATTLVPVIVVIILRYVVIMLMAESGY